MNPLHLADTCSIGIRLGGFGGRYDRPLRSPGSSFRTSVASWASTFRLVSHHTRTLRDKAE
jgi:hypothetical protein